MSDGLIGAASIFTWTSDPPTAVSSRFFSRVNCSQFSPLSSGWPSFPVLVEIHRSGTEGEWGRDEGLGDGKLKLQTQVGEGGRQA